MERLICTNLRSYPEVPGVDSGGDAELAPEPMESGFYDYMDFSRSICGGLLRPDPDDLGSGKHQHACGSANLRLCSL